MHLKIYGLFLRFLQIIISLFYRKTKNHIILGSSAGTNINGNSKALFLYMLEESTPIKGYFITRNKKLYLEHSEKYPQHFLYAYSFRALFIFISAKAYVITHGNYDVTPFKCKNIGKPFIMLWHGFPIKKLGLDSNSYTEKQKRKLTGGYDGLVVMSEEEKPIMSRCLRTNPDNVWVTGYPRNDFLFKKNQDILIPIPYVKGKKVLLYAPTFRDFDSTKLFPFPDFDKDKLEKFLISNNAILLLRIHKNELKRHNLEESNVIKVCDGNIVQEVNELLPFVDILITDYSSLYIDLLLIDKPTIFIPYDLEEFSVIRGFNFDYNKITPGPKVDLFSDFTNYIEKYLANPSLNSEDRIKIKNRFQDNQDNENSKRVYNNINNLIHQK